MLFVGNNCDYNSNAPQRLSRDFDIRTKYSVSLPYLIPGESDLFQESKLELLWSEMRVVHDPILL